MKELKQKAYNTLRWSEKYTKTDMVYLAKGGFWLTLIQIVTAVSSFALSIVFAHHFPKEAYGTYRYVLAIAGIIGTFSLTGLGSAVAQSVSNGFDNSFKYGFRQNLKWSLGSVALSFVVSAYYFLNSNSLLGISLLIAGILTPFLGSFSLYNSYLVGKKNFESLGVLSFVRSGLPTLVLITSIFLTDNVISLVTVYFFSHVVAAGICFLITLRISDTTNSNDPTILGYAKHLSLMSILNAIAEQMDKVIVFHYIGAVELAVYSFATALPTQIKSVLKNIYTLALPKFAIKPLAELQSNMNKQMLQLLFVTALSVSLYILLAPFLFSTLFPKYMESVIYSKVFALSLISVVGAIPVTVLQSKKIINGLYKTNIYFSIIKLTMLFVGVLNFGFWGVIGAKVIYEYIGVALVWWYAATSKELT